MLGLVAVIMANAYFSGVEEKQVADAEQNRMARIVVATQPLEFGKPLTPQALKLQNWPASSVPQGAFTSIQEALKDNRVALRPIVPGEPVLASKVSGTDGRATLAALLPDGFRAISIPVDNVNGVAGFVLPGMLVDVLLLRQIEGDGASSQDQRADVVLESAQVLAVDQMANDKEGNPLPSKTVTLAVNPTDASRLAVANRMGTLQLTLRKMEPDFVVDGEGPQQRVAKTMTSRNLGMPRLAIAGRGGGGGGGSGGGNTASAPRAPVFASISPPATGSVPAAAVPVYSGPAMTVVRGTEPTNYEVGTLGGRR